MRVAARKCDECLFGKNRVVSASRAASLIKSLTKQDNHFICHKSSIRKDKGEVTCHGSYELMPQLVRIAGRLGVIKFVDPETGEETDC